MLLPLSAYAQTAFDKIQMEVYCINLASLEDLLKEFGEEPFVRGVSRREPMGDIPLVIFVNRQHNTWTIVEKIETNRYCVVGLGGHFQPVPSQIRDQLKKEREGENP